MTSQASQPGKFIARVARRESPCRDHFELTFEVKGFPDAAPGQFLQVLCAAPGASDSPDAAAPLTRRPFSIAGLRRTGDTSHVSIIGRVVGAGTAWLSRLDVGDSLDILGPLGRGFSLPDEGRRALLVAGGVGVPPILWLAAYVSDRSIPCTAIIGATSGDLLPLTFEKEPVDTGDAVVRVDASSPMGVRTLTTTDDGSRGLKGRVTDGMLRMFAGQQAVQSLQVYACGPEPMLEAVALLCAEHDVCCEVSLERMMACGVGVCQSCAVAVRDSVHASGRRYALCCNEGPVFDARCVIWSSG